MEDSSSVQLVVGGVLQWDAGSRGAKKPTMRYVRINQAVQCFRIIALRVRRTQRGLLRKNKHIPSRLLFSSKSNLT